MFELKYGFKPKRLHLWRDFEHEATYTLFEIPPEVEIEEKYLLHEIYDDCTVLKVRNYHAKRLKDISFDPTTGIRNKVRADIDDYRSDETPVKRKKRLDNQREYERKKRKELTPEQRIQKRIYMRNYMRKKYGYVRTYRKGVTISQEEEYGILFLKMERNEASPEEMQRLMELQAQLDEKEGYQV
jgi:hypothetical protein